MNQGKLYRYNPDSESEFPQLVITANQVSPILQKLYDLPLTGHPGIGRTYQNIFQLYYFTGMRGVITVYVKTCAHCQQYKETNSKSPDLLQTLIMNQRNEY
ncbi:hypothetical protein EVAR_62986_1 [Eumeta japonica]|uniref:Integrase zinc-binding domain-containing protein n=1 Tax=Eumeta variegata TaxID=151549 RepID=A0A4C1ZN46_EUMVA|nr:hypothetical protein EVAR_62986_1 [Eumeta japonica]